MTRAVCGAESLHDGRCELAVRASVGVVGGRFPVGRVQVDAEGIEARCEQPQGDFHGDPHPEMHPGRYSIGRRPAR
jgi:hypothetical protein